MALINRMTIWIEWRLWSAPALTRQLIVDALSFHRFSSISKYALFSITFLFSDQIFDFHWEFRPNPRELLKCSLDFSSIFWMSMHYSGHFYQLQIFRFFPDSFGFFFYKFPVFFKYRISLLKLLFFFPSNFHLILYRFTSFFRFPHKYSIFILTTKNTLSDDSWR